MEMLAMLKELEEHLINGKQIGPVLYHLNRDECCILVQKIRASLPEEMRSARAVSSDKSRILSDAEEEAAATIRNARAEADNIREGAKRDADQILDEAHAQQTRMISESETTKIARAQAAEIVQSAEEEARLMKRGAKDYAHEVLSNLATTIGNAAAQVQNGKDALNRDLEKVR